MKVAITRDGVDLQWVIWVHLDDGDDEIAPHERPESFVVGTGDTVREAVANARQEFDLALEQLARLETSEVPS